MKALSDLIATVHQLRAPGGCAWDRAQTHQSLRQYLIEEAYEVLDVLDQIESPKDLKSERIKTSFREELGDLFMQVLLHSEMASEEQAFDIYDVAKALDEKLIRRHPHVFGAAQSDNEESALQSWEKEKAKEKASDIHASILDGVPRGLPALQKASRVLEKVTKVGFQWNDMQGPIEKVEEELAELKVELLKLEKLSKDEDQTAVRKRVEDEMGDLFFTLCNISYVMKINPEAALRGTLDRFQKRFRHVERKLKEKGKTPEQSNLQEMDIHWDEAKKIEKIMAKAEVWGLTGGAASGKSTAGQIFRKLGIPVIDADQIAKDLTKEGSLAQEQILKRFGTNDRSQLREIIFSDSKAKKDLETIMHPLIQAESTKQIESLALSHKVILYEATLLVETGRYRDLAGLIAIEAPENVRIDRLQSRDSISFQSAKDMIRSQLSDAERKKYSNSALDNSGTPEELQNKIETLIQVQGWKPKA
jgi:dephospho-CoA kinase